MNPTIEERLAAVEKAIIELKQSQGTASTSPNWLDQFRGSFKDEPAFKEVIEYGRQWRDADRLDEEFDS